MPQHFGLFVLFTVNCNIQWKLYSYLFIASQNTLWLLPLVLGLLNFYHFQILDEPSEINYTWINRCCVDSYFQSLRRVSGCFCFGGEMIFYKPPGLFCFYITIIIHLLSLSPSILFVYSQVCVCVISEASYICFCCVSQVHQQEYLITTNPELMMVIILTQHQLLPSFLPCILPPFLPSFLPVFPLWWRLPSLRAVIKQLCLCLCAQSWVAHCAHGFLCSA